MTVNWARLKLEDMLKTAAKNDPSAAGWTGPLSDQEAYALRNRAAVMAVAYAQALGMRAGFKHHDDPEFGEWNIIAYIDLPTGQVSWHLPAYPDVWDGHTVDDKYARIFEYMRGGAQ